MDDSGLLAAFEPRALAAARPFLPDDDDPEPRKKRRCSDLGLPNNEDASDRLNNEDASDRAVLAQGDLASVLKRRLPLRVVPFLRTRTAVCTRFTPRCSTADFPVMSSNSR